MAEEITDPLINVSDKDLVPLLARGELQCEIPRTCDWKSNEDKFHLEGYIDIDILYFCTNLLKTVKAKGRKKKKTLDEEKRS